MQKSGSPGPAGARRRAVQDGRARTRVGPPIVAGFIAIATVIGPGAPAAAQTAPPSGPIPNLPAVPDPWASPDWRAPTLARDYVRYLKRVANFAPDIAWAMVPCGENVAQACRPEPRYLGRDLRKHELGKVTPHHFLDAFLPRWSELVRRARLDRFTTGQGVYVPAMMDRMPEAIDAADGCAHDDGWCAMLRGVARFEQGRMAEAEVEHEAAIQALSPADGCTMTDLQFILEDAEAYRAMPCGADRDRVNDTIWWLSDPLWADPGNGRRLVHRQRVAIATLHDDFLEIDSDPGGLGDWSGHPESHHDAMVRRGDWEGGDGEVVLHAPAAWREPASAEYAFVPTWDAISDPLTASVDDWALDGARSGERARDPGWLEFFLLPHQIAVFDRGGRIIVATAAEPTTEFLERSGGAFHAAAITSTGPDQMSVRWDSVARERYTFLDTVPQLRYLGGVEVLDPDARVAARVRRGIGLPDGPLQRVRASDLLVFAIPPGDSLPGTLEEVHVGMLGRSRVHPDERLGIYWEVYGLGPAEEVELQIEAVREGGFLRSLGRSIGLVPDDFVVGWVETPGSDGAWASRSLELDLDELEAGDYTIVLTIRVEGQAPVTLDRRVSIVGG